MKKINRSVGFLINYTDRSMRRYAVAMLEKRSLGVTIEQWAAINILAENNGKLNHSELSDVMMRDRPTLTRIIDLLCKKGLTERKPDESDRRVLNIILTKAGKAKFKKGYPIVEEIRNNLQAGLDEKDFNDLIRVLDKINKNTSLT